MTSLVIPKHKYQIGSESLISDAEQSHILHFHVVFILCTKKISMPRTAAQKFNTFNAVEVIPSKQYLKKYVLFQENTTLLLHRSVH
jgi:hypothetical protein